MKTNAIYDDVIKKYKHHNQILFNRNSLSLQPLINILNEQTHQILVLWVFERVNEIVFQLDDNIKNDERITDGIKAVHEWAKGHIKMPSAKKAILDIHAIAKEINHPAMKAKIHAIGQGLSTVHVKAHSLGLVIYELTSIVLVNGIDAFESDVSQKISHYIETLKRAKKELSHNNREWASFLQKE